MPGPAMAQLLRPCALALLAGAALAAPAAAWSGELSPEQLRILDERATAKLSGSVPLQLPPIIVPGSPEAEAIARAATRPGISPWQEPARAAARRHGIPEGLFLRLVAVESGWDPAARSPRGALGLAQLMPQTAARLRVDPMDPLQNLEGGARYLRAMHERFGTWRLALAAYNAGPDAVERAGGVPPFRETRAYVEQILRR